MIEDRQEIGEVLSRLARNDCVLAGDVPTFGEPCRTSLVEVDTTRGRLLLDELLPPPTNGALDAGQNIQLSGWLDGVAIEFSVAVRRAGPGENGRCVSTELPSAIRYPQRRETFRIRMMPRAPLEADLCPGAPDMRNAEIVDLSIGGIGLLLADAEPLAARDTWKCLLRLPDDPLLTEFEPRSMRTFGKPARTRISGRFVGLTASARAMLSRYIASVQRERLRELNNRRMR
jgi:c-di-GMP-binding flagellar brake protein YcgR